MADKAYAFDENGMRELIREVQALRNQFDSGQRRQATFGMRRHQTVWMPGSGVKLVSAKNTLYAAWGGGGTGSGDVIDYGSAESNALAISLGNYVPLSEGSLATQLRRVLYPKKAYVWTLDSENVLTRTDEEVDIVNTGGLPITITSMLVAQKLEGTDYYVPVRRSNEICSPIKVFESAANVSLDGDGTPKLVRANWQHKTWPGTLSGANDETDFAHAEEFDVFIHHPGVYEVTFGMSVTRTSSDSADDTTWTDSNSDTLDLPNTMHFTGELFFNYNPAGGNITTQYETSDQIAVSVGPRGADYVTVEKTVLVQHTIDNWHGQPYMRLSFAANCLGGGSDFANASGQLGTCWIKIRPGGGGGYNEGSGFNQFNSSTGTYQWWGQGDEPEELFDADGVEIP